MKSKYLLLLFSVLSMLSGLSQKSYEMELLNFEQEDERGFTFDVRIRNTNPTEPFGIEAIQWQFSFNTALMNGGAFQNGQLTYVAGSSEMEGSRMIPLSSLFTTDQVVLNWISDILNIDERTTYLDDGDWRTIGKFRARLRTALSGTTVQNFADVLHNLNFVTNNVGVTSCNVYFDEEGAEGSGWYREDANFEEITTRTLTNSLDPSTELSGYYMNTGTDWATASNWNNLVAAAHPAYQQLPGATNNALIGVDAVISETSQVTVNNVYLKGASSLTIESTPTSTGSLIHNNTGVTATIERYIAAANWDLDGHGWHLLSSPVASQTIEGDWTPSGTGNNFDFYGFSEPEQEWINFKNTTVPPTWADFNGTDFLPGRGYLVAYEQAGTKTFTGPVNVENVANIPITRSGTPDDNNHYGWNLVGNPFASALTWTGSVAGNNLGGVAKVWDETTMAYVDIIAGSVIPSANGFFVSATEATGIVSLHSFNRVHNSQNWYKSNDERILLVAGDQQGNSAQQSVIRFNEEATHGYDAIFDAYFMAGYAPMFYSVADEKRFSTNTLPEMSSGMSIPLGFHKNSHSDFFIEMQENIEDIIIYLTDLKEDVTQNLSEEPVYYFSASADDNPDRFVISFATVSVPEVLKKGLLQAYTYGDMLYVLNPSTNAIVELYGVQGQLIMSREIGQGVNSIPVTVPSGTYIVKMVNADEAATRKVVIN
jgi:hypothetical protein